MFVKASGRRVAELTACVVVVFFPCVGAVHGDEGLVHEERPRLRPRILHHSTVHLQRPPGPERTDSTSKGHGGCECSVQNNPPTPPPHPSFVLRNGLNGSERRRHTSVFMAAYIVQEQTAPLLWTLFRAVIMCQQPQMSYCK